MDFHHYPFNGPAFSPEDKGFSKRELAAIELRIPDSGLPWLDKMIQQANHRDFMLAAVQGFCHNSSAPKLITHYAAEVAKASVEKLDVIHKSQQDAKQKGGNNE